MVVLPVVLEHKEIKRQKDKERYASLTREQKDELNRKARERRAEKKKDVINKENMRKVHVACVTLFAYNTLFFEVLTSIGYATPFSYIRLLQRRGYTWCG
jgi:hypothetical protein